MQEVLAECGSLSWGQFKPLLADAVVAHLEPIQVSWGTAYSSLNLVNDIPQPRACPCERLGFACCRTPASILHAVRGVLEFLC